MAAVTAGRNHPYENHFAMQQRVPYRRIRSTPDDAEPEIVPEPQETAATESTSQVHSGQGQPSGLLSGLGGLGQIFSQFEGDQLLILGLLVLLYKDGSSKKLLLALAYLLT